VDVEKRGQVIPDFKAATLLAFLKKHVSPGATIYTDGLKSYSDLEAAAYRHVPRIQPSRAALTEGVQVGRATGRPSGDAGCWTRVYNSVSGKPER
jgi:transposase-like protein